MEENSCNGNTACSDNRTFQQKLMLTTKVMFFLIRVDPYNLYLRAFSKVIFGLKLVYFQEVWSLGEDLV